VKKILKQHSCIKKKKDEMNRDVKKKNFESLLKKKKKKICQGKIMLVLY